MTTRRPPLVATTMLAAFAVIAVAGCSLDVTLNDDTSSRTETESIPVDDLRSIDVSTDDGTIEIRGADTDEIAIRTVLRESDNGDATYSIDVDDNRLVLNGECDDGWWDRCSVAFVVTVPTDFDIEVSSNNGRVDVSQISGRVALETDNGAIEADRLSSPDVTAQTDNGRISLDFDDSPQSVVTRSSNGAIAVRLPDLAGAYAVDASSSNGSVDIDVRVDEASTRDVTARTDNGAIDIGYRSA